MEKRLEPQLKNNDEIKAILNKVDFTHKLDDGRSVEALLIYLAPNGIPDSLTQFFSSLKNGILASFVFKCSEIEKKLGIKKEGAATKLFDKAIRKLSQHTAQGELGELILFTLLDVYLEAPKLLSKVANKTSRRMPVYGADGVHGQFYDGNFKLFLGESKLHIDFKSAASKAAKSIKSAKDKYQEEFDLLDSEMDFPNIDADLEEYLLEVLDPLSDTDLDEILHNSCFIGFSKPELLQCSTEEFEQEYLNIGKEYIADFYMKLEKQDLPANKTVLMILPFNCIEDLVGQFIKYMDIKK
ncbi:MULTISPECIES: DUF1837 domain-containing protein [Pseudoalteromonas]|jgi:hypothetical protein|uniref:HamA C-terminal domain-containing protein n=1 Tax=Pseudoalteromonas TaxID=53246 RepID=UPI000978AF30|nr:MULTISPECIES: DUF1837 domain-containing protein [Pseudoalteromonas]MAD04750.1 DUF1837 domain-containing protein [Pseudoalteromonas sp.]MBH0067405.1 DUF1837 domain-containing protein [Pseudoalteromonas sp. NZS100]|tara:strand:+ start:831 stop:1724 length:894 start_codon:yes stop_codon:yes gene_type:complete